MGSLFATRRGGGEREQQGCEGAGVGNDRSAQAAVQSHGVLYAARILISEHRP